jgi:uroporphyrinogen decarboxylase
MSNGKMTSMQRVLTSLSHKEPDRVPFFLLVTMHGARELGLSIKKYFSRAEYLVEGQIRMRDRYRHDCLYNFFYAPIETEAWGGNVIFHDNGPPNSGEPIIKNPEDIKGLVPPQVLKTPCLEKVLKATRMLKDEAKDDVPVIGVVMSPFSLPVMQMGFDKYIDLMYEHPDLFNLLMQKNQEFCINWANAQLEAGATAICYFDPVASSSISTPEMYSKTGFKVAKHTLSRIKGPTATHMASGSCLPIMDLIANTGTSIIATSSKEDLETVKTATGGKLSVLGNLDGISMRRWTLEETEKKVKLALAKAAIGGGFILSDNHGEIPLQVSEDVLMCISKAVHKWGQYPMKWITEYDPEI